MTYVAFSGEWDGRRLTVGTFKSCSRCGQAYDETNSCRGHDGGEGEPLVLEAVRGRGKKRSAPVPVQDKPVTETAHVPQHAWHCTNCGKVGYGPYSFEQYGRYLCPPPAGWWLHTNRGFRFHRPGSAEPEILVACSDPCRIALEAKYLDAPKPGFLAWLLGPR